MGAEWTDIRMSQHNSRYAFSMLHLPEDHQLLVVGIYC